MDYPLLDYEHIKRIEFILEPPQQLNDLPGPKLVK
jgi:hypothetical protein